jgi:DNA-binding LacI/PurR family transcriptional regulator
VIYNIRQFVSSAVKLLARYKVSDITLLCSDRPEDWRKFPNSPILGYQEGLKSINRLSAPDNIQKQELSIMGGFQGTTELLKRKKNCTFGIICLDSLMTMGLFQALMSQNLRMPEDVMVVSHANPDCQLAIPCLPVIYYITPVDKQLDLIISMAHKYLKTGMRNFGDKIIDITAHPEPIEKYLTEKKSPVK